MPPATDEFGQYLALEEPLTSVCTARLSDDAGWTPVTVALTDRRLLCLADDGTFVSVDFDAISAVRGRPRSSLGYRGDDRRLQLTAGVLVAVLGVLAVGAVAGGLLAPALAVLGLGGLAAAAYVRRHGADGDLVEGLDRGDLGPVDPVDGEFESVRETARRVGDRVSEADLGDRAERPGEADDGGDPLRAYANRVRDAVDRAGDGAGRARDAAAAVAAETDRDRALLAAAAAVGVGGMVGALLAAPDLLVLPGLAFVVAGAGLVDHARRNESSDGDVEAAREREREVRVSTTGGREVHLRSEPSTGLARDLGRLASAAEARTAQVVSPRS